MSPEEIEMWKNFMKYGAPIACLLYAWLAS